MSCLEELPLSRLMGCLYTLDTTESRKAMVMDPITRRARKRKLLVRKPKVPVIGVADHQTRYKHVTTGW